MAPVRRRLIVIVACAAALAGCGGDDSRIAPEVRAAGLRFAPTVAETDRAWILAAIEQARPEARQLVDDVDGMVVVTTFGEPTSRAVGVTQRNGPGDYEVRFNLGYLDGERKLDRNATVLHELGHVIDDALVPPELRDRLAAQLPVSGACLTADTGDCTSPPERFADTFAKWALRGAVSAVGAGYSLATPASLEDWGAPLATLAIEIDVASR
jgi:hypothetical protein